MKRQDNGALVPNKTLAAVCGLYCETWLGEIRERYACPQCHTINSGYDLKCRKCGKEPSCTYGVKHKKEIERYLMNRK